MNNFGTHTLLLDRANDLNAVAPLDDAIVVHGDRARFAPFLVEPALRDPASLMAAWDGTPNMARAWSPPGGHAFELHPTREQIGTLYNAGFTIVLEEVERWLPSLRPLCRKLEEDLGVAAGSVYVEAFMAMAGACARPHFDHSFTFNCQVDGTKTWWLAKNEALPYAPHGMFLGRPIPPALEHIVSARSLPSKMPPSAREIVAEPGTVVFLPPGVMHETRTETPSFAILFALETDQIAKLVSTRIRRRLEHTPLLRASRLGAQMENVDDEARFVAGELRKIADEIEKQPRAWAAPDDRRVRLPRGLRAERISESTIELRSVNKARVVNLDPDLVAILGWASGREAFRVRELSTEIAIDPKTAEECLQKLMTSGLLEHVAP